MSENIIEIRNLTKNYGKLPVLKGVDLDIVKGSIHGLVGTSGVGKSTLLRTINGVEDIDSGTLKVIGQNIPSLNETEMLEIRKDISMIFQNFALMESKNVFDNVAFPMRIWRFPEKDIKEKVNQLLELVHLDDKKLEKPRNLSGGQRQRVAIARALTLNPKILLSDEATSGLDPVTANNIIKLLLNINNNLGITMVVVTHQMDVAKQICDTISIMKDGNIVETDSVQNVFMNNSAHLIDLVGPLKLDISDSENKEVFRLFLSSKIFPEPILDILSKTGVKYTLEFSQIDNGKDGRFGSFYISVLKQDGAKAYSVLSNIKDLVIDSFDFKEGRISNVRK